jgi:hypothetical protein
MISLSEYSGANAHRLEFGDLFLWFSYETVVAFKEPGKNAVVSENIWSNTTGNHINTIDGGRENKKHRLPRAQFANELEEMLMRRGLVK